MTSRTHLTKALVQRFPYEITCTSCETRLVAVDTDWIVLVGPRPIEVIYGLDGETQIACHGCGTIVPIDRDLLMLH